MKCGPRLSKVLRLQKMTFKNVEMTVEGGASSAGDPADEDPFEKQMRLSYESQVRVSTVQRYGKPQALGSTRGVDEKKTNSLHL